MVTTNSKKRLFATNAPVKTFLEEMCEMGTDYYEDKLLVLKAYRRWSDSKGMIALASANSSTSCFR